MRCLHCNKTIRDDAVVCPRCGNVIPRCPTCGKVITRNVSYCPADGTPLPKEVLALLPGNLHQAGNIRLSDDMPPAGDGDSTRRSRNSNFRDNLLAIAVLLTVVVAAYFLLGGNKPRDTQDPALMAGQSQEAGLSQDEEFYWDEEPEVPAAPVTEAPTDPPTEPPTEAPTEAPKTALDYWIQNCDSVRLTSEDLQSFNKEECRLARNAIYAKSGRRFNDKALQRYFEAFDWYDPSVDPDDFRDSMLNSIQTHNLELILEFEQRKGYR